MTNLLSRPSPPTCDCACAAALTVHVTAAAPAAAQGGPAVADLTPVPLRTHSKPPGDQPACPDGNVEGSSGGRMAGGSQVAHSLPGYQPGSHGGGAEGSSGDHGADTLPWSSRTHARTCSMCGHPAGSCGAKLKACGRCLSVRYCSAACQRRHWGEGGHREACSQLRESREGGKPAVIDA